MEQNFELNRIELPSKLIQTKKIFGSIFKLLVTIFCFKAKKSTNLKKIKFLNLKQNIRRRPDLEHNQRNAAQ